MPPSGIMENTNVSKNTAAPFSEALYCKQIMVGNRQMLGLGVPKSEEINALLRDVHDMASRLKSEYGLRMLLEDACMDECGDQLAADTQMQKTQAAF